MVGRRDGHSISRYRFSVENRVLMEFNKTSVDGPVAWYALTNRYPVAVRRRFFFPCAALTRLAGVSQASGGCPAASGGPPDGHPARRLGGHPAVGGTPGGRPLGCDGHVTRRGGCQTYQHSICYALDDFKASRSLFL